MKKLIPWPPVTEKKFFAELSEMEEINSLKIDGKMISNIIRFCYFFALKKGELINLNVGDVTGKGGAVLNRIRVGNDELPVTDRTRELIQTHYNFLGERGYKRFPYRPLLPAKPYRPLLPAKNVKRDGIVKPYGSTTLKRHLKWIFNKSGLEYEPLEKIRQSGIYRFYDDLLSKGFSKSECLVITRNFARLNDKDDRQLTKILSDANSSVENIKDPFQKYLELIEQPIAPSKEYEERLFKALIEKIPDDPELIESEKSELLSKLRDRLK